MSIEKCMASESTPAECYVNKTEQKHNLQRTLNRAFVLRETVVQDKPDRDVA